MYFCHRFQFYVFVSLRHCGQFANSHLGPLITGSTIFVLFFSVTFLHTEEIGFIKSPFKSIDTTVQLDDLIRVRLN